MKDINLVAATFVIMLFVSFPLSFALSINNINTATSDRYAIVNWQTDQPSSSRVLYGTDSSRLISTAQDTSLVKNHSVIISPLPKSTNYYFNISSSNPNETASSGTYNFSTTSSDTTIPFINAELPEFTGNTQIDVSGQTEPNALILISVNGNVTRSMTTLSNGRFFIPSVLLRVGANQVKLTAVDPSDNRNEITRTVTVDKSPPAITISEPSALKSAFDSSSGSFALGVSSFTIRGNSDEPAQMEITITDSNNVQVFKQQIPIASPWQVAIPSLKDGTYTLELYALDRAGNPFDRKFVLLIDTQPLTITSNIGRLSPSYVVFQIVRGTTKPGAIVVLVVNNKTTAEATHLNLSAGTATNFPTSLQELIQRSGYRFTVHGVSQRAPLNYVTTADESGNFQIDMELTSEITVAVNSSQFSAGNAWVNHVELLATDQVGNVARTGIKDIVYTRCSSGGLFTISNIVPSPGSIPEPVLEQGYGMFTLSMDVNYVGTAEKKDVHIVGKPRVTVQQLSREDREGRYNLTVPPNGIFSSAAVYPNTFSAESKQLYAVISLKALTPDRTRQLFPQQISRVSQVVNARLEFPLELDINYNYLAPNGQTESNIQKTCIDTVIEVEPDATHFTQYIPTNLMRNALNAINTTINLITTAQTYIRQAWTVALIGCGVGTVIQTFVVIYDRFAYCGGRDPHSFLTNGCKINYPDKEGTLALGDVDCSGLKLDGGAVADENVKQNAQQCLYQTYTTVNQYQQYLVNIPCDRVFCPSVPSLYRHSLTYSDLLVTPAARVTQGQSIRGVVSTNLGNAKSQCSGLGNAYDTNGCVSEFNRGWKWTAITYLPYDSAFDRAYSQVTTTANRENTEFSLSEFFQRAESAVSNVCSSTDTDTNRYVQTDPVHYYPPPPAQGGLPLTYKISSETVNRGTQQESTIIKLYLGTWDRQVYLRSQEQGGNVLNPTPELERTWFTPLHDFTHDDSEAQREYGRNKNGEYVCRTQSCVDMMNGVWTEADIARGDSPTPMAEDSVPANWKMSSKIVAMLAGLESKDYSFDPTSNLFNSARAMCLPALYGHLTNFKTMLTQARICLQRVANGEEASAGTCRAFLSTVICDSVANLFSCIGAISSRLFASSGLGNSLNFNTVNPFQALTTAGQAMSDTISSRYGGTNTYKTLFDQNKLIRSFCVAAFTGDWDLGFVSDLLNQNAIVPVQPECLPAIGQRRFISSNPTQQGKPTYLYHVAGMLTGSAEVSGVSFQLICSDDTSCTQYDETSNPGGRCDCFGKGEKTTNIQGVPNTVAVGSVLDQEKYLTIQNQEYRYDKFRILYTWKNNLGQTKTETGCTTYLRSEGFPPSTCSFDLSLGSFRCTFNVGEQGTARFIDNPAPPVDTATGQPMVFTVGDSSRNVLKFPTRIEVISPEGQQLNKFVRFTIWNQANRKVVNDVYYPLNQGQYYYDSFPGNTITQNDFSASSTSVPSVEVGNNNGGITVPLTNIDYSRAAQTARYVVTFDNNGGYRCNEYTVASSGTASVNVFGIEVTKITAVPDTRIVHCPLIDLTLVGYNDKTSVKGNDDGPGEGNEVSSYDGTYILVTYVPSTTVPPDCTSAQSPWHGEASLFYANGDTPSTTIVTDENGAPATVTFNFYAVCKQPTVSPQNIVPSQASTATTNAVVMTKPFSVHRLDLPLYVYNFSKTNPSDELFSSYEATSGGNITQINLTFTYTKGGSQHIITKNLFNDPKSIQKSVQNPQTAIPLSINDFGTNGADLPVDATATLHVYLNKNNKNPALDKDAPSKISFKRS